MSEIIIHERQLRLLQRKAKQDHEGNERGMRGEWQMASGLKADRERDRGVRG